MTRSRELPSSKALLMTPPSRWGCHLRLRTPQYGVSRVAALIIVLAGILLANMVPNGDVAHMAHAQTADSSIEYAENGTRSVGAFHAYDQDGDAIEWSLSGPDADRFTIDGGVLAFRESPDYEDPRSAARTNVYRVTVEASGGTHDVAVTVTDVDEAGTVSIDRPQPQASRPLGALLSDEDDGVTGERWQWSRSADGTTWTDIEGATSPRRSPAPDDVDTYLRATVTYSDKFGADKTASAVSANVVEARTLSNAAPSFAEQDEDEDTPYIEVTRSVAENTATSTAIGSAVSALDADGDILFYELLDTTDLEDSDGLARFTIDSASGQIRVGKVLGADAREHLDDPSEREDEDSTDLTGSPALPTQEEADDEDNSEYVLRVRVSDPSTASATVNVIVTVTNVNEPPAFDEKAPTLLRVTEGTVAPLSYGDATPTATVDADTYDVTDQDGSVGDGPNSYDDTTYTYSVTGADSDVLTFNGGDTLGFRAGHEPDYEEQSSYSITVEASSGEGARTLSATLDVTIEVVNGEDAGAVILSQREPQIGRVVHATVSDPDGGVRVSRWTWERSEKIDEGTPSAECRDDTDIPDVVGWESIDGATSSSYTPTLADVGRCLRARATYTDNIAGDPVQATGVTEAPVQSSNPANTAPHFVVQASSTSRRVFENTEARQDIGTPLSAHDDDDDLLVHTLGGAHASSFDISRNNGQLKTKAPLDFEDKRVYVVEVTATDPSGAAASILVFIGVINENEPAEITGTSAIDFAENGTARVASFTARDPERRSIRWSLGGRDADRFTISRGALRFKRLPNHEDPHSALEGAGLAERNVYRVTLEASGGTHDVAVRVTDVDEPGTVSMDRPQPQVDRPLSVSLLDEDEGVAAERWQWARSEDGTTWTDIEGATSPKRSPAPDDVGMYLRATVAYSDKFGAGKTASAVSANPVEAKTASNAAPSFAGQDDDESTPYIDVARSVPENTAEGMPIGEPVAATDADEDVLFYELLDTPDLADDDGHARFTIDSLTGQIRVAEVLGANAGEAADKASTALTGGPELPDGEDAGDAGNSEYVLRVRVSDPSTASATVNVVVTITEVNEPPLFREDAPTMLRVRENADPLVITIGDGDTPVPPDTYVATDQDSDDTTDNYSLSGTDRSAFAIDSNGVLSFKPGHKPDFEKQSSYAITVTATSGAGERMLTAKLDVVIEVVNTHDLGEVMLSQRQPNVGIGIVATLSDPDGGVEINRWLWERTENDRLAPSAKCEGIEANEVWLPIGDALSAVYAPKPTDVGRCLRATAFYTDSLDDTVLEATGVLEFPTEGVKTDDPDPGLPSVNAAPDFPDQDFLTPGVQSDRTSREVAENTKAAQPIGAPVKADDADELHRDKLIYTLGGPDARAFDIVRETGQIRTWIPLDYEARNTYTVVVTARDPVGATASIQVTIHVTDEDDPAEITVNAGETGGGP